MPASLSGACRANVDDRTRIYRFEPLDAVEHLLPDYRPVEMLYDFSHLLQYLRYRLTFLLHSYYIYPFSFRWGGSANVLEGEARKEIVTARALTAHR